MSEARSSAQYISFFFCQRIHIYLIIQAKVVSRMEDAAMSFIFQLQKAAGSCKSVMYFDNRVYLCYKVRVEELISTLHNGQLNTVYMPQFYS